MQAVQGSDATKLLVNLLIVMGSNPRTGHHRRNLLNLSAGGGAAVSSGAKPYIRPANESSRYSDAIHDNSIDITTMKFLPAILLLAAACIALEAKAEVAPQTLDGLQQSDLIVVGTIKEIRVQTERSQIERGFGNDDWGIYITLDIENVEKGHLKDSEIEFRCFRIKSRRSATEYLTPSGHRPIPGTGTSVRVYLNGEKPNWVAALPNGITAPNANDDESVWSGGGLTDATEIRELQSPLYTFVLPLEAWAILVFLVTPIAIMATVLIRRAKRRRTYVPNRTEQSKPA